MQILYLIKYLYHQPVYHIIWWKLVNHAIHFSQKSITLILPIWRHHLGLLFNQILSFRFFNIIFHAHKIKYIYQSQVSINYKSNFLSVQLWLEFISDFSKAQQRICWTLVVYLGYLFKMRNIFHLRILFQWIFSYQYL